MKRLLLCLLMIISPISVGEQLEAVDVYGQDELLAMIRTNSHLKRVRDIDDCQLVQDIEARAEVMKVPAYQFLWADMLLYNVCVKKDIEQGFYFLKLAAEQGLPDALEQLGRYYMQGRFVVSDSVYGMKLIHAAAGAGHPKARLQYARYLVGGDGSPRDYPGAVYWLRDTVFESSAQRNEAEQLVDQLLTMLPPSEREKARKTSINR